MSSLRLFSGLIFSLINVASLAGCMNFEVGQQTDLSVMATTITPGIPAFSSSLTEPTAGDPVQSAQLRVDNAQKLLNAIEAARLGLYGGGIRRRVVCTDNTTMTILPLGSVVVTDGTGKWLTIANITATSVSPTAMAGSLSASTRYWVYAYAATATTIDFVASINAPDTGLFYESANTQRLYVSTFITDNSANVLAYSQSDCYYQYAVLSTIGVGLNGNLILNAGHALSATISAGSSVPAGASSFDYTFTVQKTGSAFQGKINPNNSPNVELRIGGDGTTLDQSVSVSGRSSVNQLDYGLTDTGTTAFVWVRGFTY